jgi:iron complex outermembrane receptor protein
MTSSVPVFSKQSRQRQHDRALFRHTPVAAAVFAGFALLSSGALAAAQDGGEEKLAKADSDKGDVILLDAVAVNVKKVKEVSKSISLVTGEELEKFHVNNFRDIVNRIGNVRTSWQNPNSTSLFIRGVGWAAGASPLDPSVGLTIDGVSYGITAVAALANFTDIDTVSVTRGPAGVEGGKNASLGEVRITTRAPSFTPEARASITFGQLNTVSSTASLGGGIVDDLLAYRFSINRETADGPYHNANDSQFSWRNTDRTNVRTQFLYTPSNTLNAKLTIDYTPTGREICENCFTFFRPTPHYYDSLDAKGNPIAVNLNEDAFGKVNRRWFQQKTDWSYGNYVGSEINRFDEYPNTYASKGVALNVNADVGGAVISSITGYKDYTFSQGAGSHTPFDWLRAPSHQQTEYNQISQELKLDSRFNDSVKYQAGLYLLDAKFPNNGNTERYGSDSGAYYANKTQYDYLDANPLVPASQYAQGRQLLLNSADGLIVVTKSESENKSAAIFSNINWGLTQDLDLNAGLRITKEHRTTSGSNLIGSQGFGAELNPVSSGNVQLGGFASTGTGGLTPGANSAAQLALADSVAYKYFGVAATGTPGAAYNSLTPVQQQQVAYAKAIRLARIAGNYVSLYRQSEAEAYDGTLPTVTLGSVYRLNDLHSTFVSWKHGEKAGVSQLVGATANGGKSALVNAEKSDAFEIGSKSLFLQKDLSLNTTLYLQNITDYIQPMYFYDAVLTQLNNNGINAYTSGLGNVPKVQTKGAEVDLAYYGFKFTTLRFSGAYTDARYKDFKFAAKPLELGGTSTPYYDATGKTLPGAPKFSGNLFADYSYPISGGKVAHADINYNYQTRYNNDIALSRYAEVASYGVADISIGIGRQDKKFDVSLVVKNAFNKDTGFNTNWSNYKPGIPRWIGVTLVGQL